MSNQQKIEKINQKLAKIDSKHYNSIFYYEVIVELRRKALLRKKDLLQQQTKQK